MSDGLYEDTDTLLRMIAEGKIVDLTVDQAKDLVERYDPLELDGLTTLSAEAAEILAGCQEGPISLNGLTVLSAEAATALAYFAEYELSLDGLTSLSEEAAKALAESRGGLSLNGLTSLSEEAAKALAKHTDELSLDGLTSLSDKAAKALAKHERRLSVAGLTTLSDEAAAALRANPNIRLPKVKKARAKPRPDVRRKKAKAPKKKAAGKVASTASPPRGPNKRAGAVQYQLVIVESPTKAKAIETYLGEGFVVIPSLGHIRDLPSRVPTGSRQPVPGVDLDNNFAATYEIDPAKQKTVTELRKLAEGATAVWFATDLDREGEAVAWHLTQVLGVDPAKAKRVTFNAITKSTVQRAFQSPRAINMPRVEAEQASRIVDRIVGYQVSPVLWKKGAGPLSVGRVQSVATRIVVDREEEIRTFTPAESWNISAFMTLDTSGAATLHREWRAFLERCDDRRQPPLVRDRVAWLGDRRSLRCEMVECGGKPLCIDAENTSTADLADDACIAAEAAGLLDIKIERATDPDGRGRGRTIVQIVGRPDPRARYTVEAIEEARSRSQPFPPFITSTLQQAASSLLGMSPDHTMRIAQQLYEGIYLPNEGHVGLITYIRTDATNLSDEAIDIARHCIRTRLGDDYLPDAPRVYASSNSRADGADEAIRPTDPAREPDAIAAALTYGQFKLYRLIWQCFLASQAIDAEWVFTTVRLRRTDRDTGVVLNATARLLRVDGFYRISGVPRDDGQPLISGVTKGDQLALIDIEPRQKFENPPPRYTAAHLIKELDTQGIGRPSTYAGIINLIERRGYVEQNAGVYHPTPLAEAVAGFLKRGFREGFMDIANTRALERDLDHVAQGTKTWTGVLHEFYKAFMPQLESALQEPYEKPGQSCEAGPFIAGKGLANSDAGFKCLVVPAEIQASKDLLAFWKKRKKDLLNDNPRGLPKAGLELRDDLQLVLRGITAGLTGECSAVALPPHHLDEYLVDPPDEMRDLICRHTKKGGPGFAIRVNEQWVICVLCREEDGRDADKDSDQ